VTDTLQVKEKHNADLVWTQSDGLRNEIFISSYAKREWSVPVQLTDDNANNLHPAVDTDANGIQWLAWTAVDDGTYSIRTMFISKQQEKSDIQIVSSELPNNIYPTIIIDHFNVPWVIWSATADTNDDIFFSRFLDGKWQKPQPLHISNDVPDIRPIVDLTEKGTPLVQWQRYMDGGYQSVSSFWMGDKWSLPIKVDQEDFEEETESEIEQVPLPDTIKEAQNLFIKIYN